LILFAMVFQAKSQIVKDTMPWCPPGASWLYNMITATESYYRQYNYEKDTLIDGKLAKKIIGWFYQNFWLRWNRDWL